MRYFNFGTAGEVIDDGVEDDRCSQSQLVNRECSADYAMRSSTVVGYY